MADLNPKDYVTREEWERSKGQIWGYLLLVSGFVAGIGVQMPSPGWTSWLLFVIPIFALGSYFVRDARRHLKVTAELLRTKTGTHDKA